MRLPGTHAWPCCMRSTSSCLVMDRSLLCAPPSRPLRRLQAGPICASMGYETDLKLFIDGVWKSGEGRDTHALVNPVTASAIAEVPYATPADLQEALAASGRAWPEWRALDVREARRDPAQGRGAAARARRPYRRDADSGAGQDPRPKPRPKCSRRRNCSTGMPRTPSAITAAPWSARRASYRA